MSRFARMCGKKKPDPYIGGNDCRPPPLLLREPFNEAGKLPQQALLPIVLVGRFRSGKLLPYGEPRTQYAVADSRSRLHGLVTGY